MRSALFALILAVLPTIALAEGFYSQARIGFGYIGNLNDIPYDYISTGLAFSVWGDLNADKAFLLLVSGEVLNCDTPDYERNIYDNQSLGFRGATELHWTFKKSFVRGGVMFSAAYNRLPGVDIFKMPKATTPVKELPEMPHVQPTWLVDLTVGPEFDFSIGSLFSAPSLEWLGLYGSTNLGVAVGPHTDETGMLVAKMLTGLRVSL